MLAAWSGLGYYRRARMLHAATKNIVKEHGGKLPGEAEDLRALTWDWPIYRFGDCQHCF